MATQTTTLRHGSIAAIPSTSPITGQPKPVERTRPYKDFLTPALHRRFTQAAVFVLAICWIDSIFIGPPSILWIWNPISSTGLRGLVLCIPCLAIFIVRVNNTHIGARLARSSAAEVYSRLTAFTTYHALTWYLIGAFVFGEVFIWSGKESSNLGWIDPGRAYERPRLNEQPLVSGHS